MRIVETLVRWGKLGFFVGWGVGTAIWSACSSSPAPRPDSPVDLKRAPESRPAETGGRDAGLVDLGARDGKAAEQRPADLKPAVDKRAWDIPLE